MNRLFFALWPDDGVRQQIEERQPKGDVLGGRRVSQENYHLTLAFMAQVSDRQWERLEMNASTLQFDAFNLQLDCVGHWPHAQVAWLGCQHPPQGLLDLVGGLKQMLQQVGLPVEQRPYQPHISLRRKVREWPADQSVATIEWPVREYVLSRSIIQPDGPHYQVIGRWPLRQ